MFKRVLIFSAVAALAGGPAAAQPPVWVVRDADSEIVIFGSVHLLPPGLDWTPPALDAALKRADDIWFELPIDPASTAESGRLAIQKGLAPPGGERLSAKLSPTGQARLARFCGELGLSRPVIEAMQPWLAEMTLVISHLARQGASGSAGVEQTLAAAAPAAARRRAFETPAEQIGFFADAPEADQIASLEDSLRVLEEEPAAFGKLIDAWVRGDLAALEAEGLAPLRTAAPGLYDRLIVRRNARWADALAERLAGSGESVVVVGAGHLVGSDGLPAMLRARGIAVEGP